MKILVSNDDGVYAPGIRVLAEHMAEIAQIAVVGPDRNRTAASHSLTLHRPLRISRLENGYIAVNGTPTDCVHMAVSGVLDLDIDRPDMVVSGINAGENLGDDVFYSGTVAAAIEGRSLGYPSIAVSLSSPSDEFLHYETAAKVTQKLVMLLKTHPLPQDTILSVNVPDVPYDQLKGMEVCRLGRRHFAEKVYKEKDPYGRPIYWIGPAGSEEDGGEGTDFHAIARGYAAVTPLQLDMTKHALLGNLKDWILNVR